MQIVVKAPEDDATESQINPFDVNLVDLSGKECYLIYLEAILMNSNVQQFNFLQYNPYHPRYIVVTKSALRIYENKNASLGQYSKPLIAIPLSAVNYAARTRFDIRDDDRLNVESLDQWNKNTFEIFVKDEFLPIYLHQNYMSCFKDQSMAMERTPGRSSDRKSVGASPLRGSTVSGQSQRLKNKLDMQRRTTTEQKSSPSKAARITLKYI